MARNLRLLLLGSACSAIGLMAGGAQASSKIECEGLSAEALGLSGFKVVSSKAMEPGEDSPTNHCLLEGVTAERTGTDGKAYALKFELRLPDDWNGRFVHQFNGGNDGKVVPAFGLAGRGNPTTSPLAKGYAVVSSDAGHDGSANPDAGLAGSNMFGFDPEARSFYGYKAVQLLNPLAQSIVEAYYGKAPEYTYGVGCSNGGRHGFVAASRMGEDFDGILAGAPGFNLPRAAIQHALDVQSLKAINGDVRKSFTPEEQRIVGRKILAVCDKLDGLEDGIVADTQACQSAFDPDTLTCQAGQNSECISEAQTNALKVMYGGPKTSDGKQLYSDWAWDPGISSGNWRFWKIESPIPPWDNMPLIAVMGAGSLAQIFTTPPTPVAGDPASLEKFLLGFDLDRDGPKVDGTSDMFAESAMEFMTPPDSDDPKLSTFKDAGHKMIVYHGVADPVFSYNDTVDWYEKLDANHDGKAGEFAKLYPVPNMAHCDGGPTTDSFDLFSKLVDWVEKGEEPAEVVAGLSDGNRDLPESWPKERTRKLCPYPQVARYKDGNSEEAASFVCE